jgi:hypothetical protein
MVSLWSVIPAYGMEFSITHQNPYATDTVSYPVLLMKGEIRPGDHDRLIRFALTNNFYLPLAPAILSSPGGDINEALKIGRLVQSLYMTVDVGPVTGSCASACFIIFASAVDRDAVAGVVGIHRPYLSRDTLQKLTPREAAAAEAAALKDAEAYLRELRVPRHLIDEMFENASTEIHWLSDEELMHELGRRPPWYEEFLIARCGLDKAAEDLYFHQPDSLPYSDLYASELHAADRCGQELTIEEAKSSYYKVTNKVVPLH